MRLVMNPESELLYFQAFRLRLPAQPTPRIKGKLEINFQLSKSPPNRHFRGQGRYFRFRLSNIAHVNMLEVWGKETRIKWTIYI